MSDELLQELRLTLSKMELSLGAINDAIIWVDEQGNIQWNNKSFSQLLKLNSIAILGNNIQSLLPLKKNGKEVSWGELLEANADDCVNNVYEIIQDSKIMYYEICAKQFYSAKEDKSIVIVLHDVTTQHLSQKKIKKAYDEISKSEFIKSKLAAIVESTEAAIIGRSLSGQIESWNKGAEILYGYKASEVIGKSVKLIYPENKADEFESTAKEVASGQTVKILDTERKCQNGQRISVSVIISPIRNTEGAIVGSCSIARDIGELKKMMTIKNDFISTVNHELRTPLTSIQGSLSLLLSNLTVKLPDQVNKLLLIAKQNCDRLLRLINDILDIQKIESGKMELHLKPIQIGNLIQEALIANNHFANQFSVKMEVIQESTATIMGDKDKLLQVFANLISNAIKFSDSDRIQIKTLEKNNHVRIEVINQGKGIPENYHDQVFQKFFQAKNIIRPGIVGTGLGLSISKEIIEKHHGTIGFRSEPGHTTMFYCELPIMQEY